MECSCVASGCSGGGYIIVLWYRLQLCIHVATVNHNNAVHFIHNVISHQHLPVFPVSLFQDTSTVMSVYTRCWIGNGCLYRGGGKSLSSGTQSGTQVLPKLTRRNLVVLLTLQLWHWLVFLVGEEKAHVNRRSGKEVLCQHGDSQPIIVEESMGGKKERQR